MFAHTKPKEQEEKSAERLAYEQELERQCKEINEKYENYKKIAPQLQNHLNETEARIKNLKQELRQRLEGADGLKVKELTGKSLDYLKKLSSDTKDDEVTNPFTI